jgi:hypothetical protein
MKHGCVVALLTLAGCGDPLASGAFRPPYVTVSGRMTSDTPSAGNLYVALLWENDHGDGVNYVAQQVAVRSDVDQLAFRLDVSELPPAAAIHALPPGDPFFGIDPELRWAVGTLIVYADDNGNGQLDFVDAAGELSPDRVLAAADGYGDNADLRIFYLADGRPADPLWTGDFPVAPGFSLARSPRACDPAPGDCGGFAGEQHWADACAAIPPHGESLEPGSFVQLKLVEAADLQRYACRSFWGPLDYADWSLLTRAQIGDGPQFAYCVGTHCPLDTPPDGQADACSTDGTAYVYKRCRDDADRCGTRFCHFGHGERRVEDPIPAGWPTCPAVPLSAPSCPL